MLSDNSVAPFLTENLLEDIGGLLRPLLSGDEATHQRPIGAVACGSRFPADVCSSDDVIAFEGLSLPAKGVLDRLVDCSRACRWVCNAD